MNFAQRARCPRAMRPDHRYAASSVHTMTSSGFRHLFKKILTPSRPERPLHALDCRLAKEWIKKRLAALYPELRGDSVALEKAYRELDLEPTGAVHRVDGEVKSFEMNLPSTINGGFDQS